MRLAWLFLLAAAVVANPSVYQVTGPDADQVLVSATQDSNDEVIVYFNVTETTCTENHFLFQYPSTVRLIGLGSSETTLRECYFYFIRDAGDGQFEARGFDVIDLLYTNGANNPFLIVADHATFTDVSFSDFATVVLADLTTNEAEFINCSYSNGPFRNAIEGPQILVWLHSGVLLMDNWTTDFLDWYGYGVWADGDSASVTVRNSHLTGISLGILVSGNGQNQLHVYDTHFTNFSAVDYGGSWFLAAAGSETLIENCTFSDSMVYLGFESFGGGNFASRNNIWSNVSALYDGMSLLYLATKFQSYNESFINCSGSVWNPSSNERMGSVIDSVKIVNHNNPHRGIIYSKYTGVHIKNSLFQNIVNINTAVIQIAPEGNIYRSYMVTNCTFIDVLSWQGTVSAKGFLGNLTIDGSSFIRTQSLHNGGAITISSEAGTISINNTQFINCTASGNGGVAYLKINRPSSNNIPFHSLTVANVTLHGNSAGDSGGGFYLIGTIPQIMMQSMRTYNQYCDVFGGVVFIGSSTESLQLSLLDLQNNVAGTSGGGIFIQGNVSQIDLSNITGLNNSAIYEGGMIVLGGTHIMNQARMEDIQCSHSQSYYGSCISISSSLINLTLNRVNVTYGEGQQGGAVQVSSTVNSLIVSDCVFLQNQAGFLGGALSLTGTMQHVNLYGNTFMENSALQGGAIGVTGNISTMTIDTCKIMGNKGQGGGLYMSPSQAIVLALNGTELEGNIADADGGAIFALSSLPVHLILKNVTLHSNYASGNAGGIYFETVGGMVTMERSVMRNNTSGNSGGGIQIINSDFRSTEAEWSNNYAAVRGGAIDFVLQVNSSAAKRYLSSFEIGDRSCCTLDITGSEYKGNMSPLGASISTNGDTAITTSSFHDSSSGPTMMLSNTATISDSIINNGNIWLMDGSVTVLSRNQVIGRFTVNMDNAATIIDGGGNTQPLRDSIVCNDGYQLNTTLQSSQCILIPATPASDQTIDVTDQERKIIIGAAVGSVIGVAIIAVAVISLVMYRQSLKQKMLIRDAKYSNSYNSINFSVIQLGAAKQSVINFDDLQAMKKIGEGAYGIVYVAIFRAIQVAVKQIKAEMVTEVQLKDFLHEVSIIQNLRAHPHVVSFVGLTFHPQPLSLVTEYCGGGALDRFISENNPPLSQRICFIEGIALGMLHLHAEGIIHRDLAVRNILLTSHHNVKVADFGMSRAHNNDETAAKTQSDVGPLKWMAPEAIINKEYSKKSDIYSYGVTIWEILTGEEPYAEMSGLEAAIGVTTNGLRLSIPAGTDAQLSKLMSLCWSSQPHNRPSFDEVCYMLNINEKTVETAEQSEDNMTSNHYKQIDIPK